MDVLLGDFEKRAFGLAKELEGFGIFVVSVFGDGSRGGNETATNGGFIDDFGIGLRVCGGRDKTRKLGKIGGAAGFFGELFLFELVANG